MADLETLGVGTCSVLFVRPEKDKTKILIFLYFTIN